MLIYDLVFVGLVFCVLVSFPLWFFKESGECVLPVGKLSGFLIIVGTGALSVNNRYGLGAVEWLTRERKEGHSTRICFISYLLFGIEN